MLKYHNNKDLVFTQDRQYVLTSVVCDVGIYEKCNKDEIGSRLIEGSNYKLSLIINSRSIALSILKLLDKDSIKHMELQNDPR